MTFFESIDEMIDDMDIVQMRTLAVAYSDLVPRYIEGGKVIGSFFEESNIRKANELKKQRKSQNHSSLNIGSIEDLLRDIPFNHVFDSLIDTNLDSVSDLDYWIDENFATTKEVILDNDFQFEKDDSNKSTRYFVGPSEEVNPESLGLLSAESIDQVWISSKEHEISEDSITLFYKTPKPSANFEDIVSRIKDFRDSSGQDLPSAFEIYCALSTPDIVRSFNDNLFSNFGRSIAIRSNINFILNDFQDNEKYLDSIKEAFRFVNGELIRSYREYSDFIDTNFAKEEVNLPYMDSDYSRYVFKEVRDAIFSGNKEKLGDIEQVIRDNERNIISVAEVLSLEVEGYRVVKKLDKGGYGSVYLLEEELPELKEEGLPKAKKVLKLPSYTEESVFSHVEEEDSKVSRVIRSNSEYYYLNSFGGNVRPFFPSVQSIKVKYKKTFSDLSQRKSFIPNDRDGYSRAGFLMDYIEGDNISDLIEEGVPLNLRYSLVGSVAHTLRVLHDKCGIVHKDLNSRNLIFTDEGNAVLLDFGLASTLKGRLNEFGSRFYASPEQYEAMRLRDDESNATFESDRYQLGILLYEILTGQKPQAIVDRLNEEFMTNSGSKEKFSFQNIGDYAEPIITREVLDKIVPPHELDKKIDISISSSVMELLDYNPRFRSGYCISHIERMCNSKVEGKEKFRRFSSSLKELVYSSFSNSYKGILGLKQLDDDEMYRKNRKLKRSFEDFVSYAYDTTLKTIGGIVLIGALAYGSYRGYKYLTSSEKTPENQQISNEDSRK